MVDTNDAHKPDAMGLLVIKILPQLSGIEAVDPTR